MSNEFKIVKEHSFYFKNGKDICIMLLRDRGVPAIEVVTNVDSFGRMFFPAMRMAEKEFDTMANMFAPDTTYETMHKYFKLCKKVDRPEKLDLLVSCEFGSKKTGQSTIGKIVEKHNLKIKTKYTKDKNGRENGMLIDVIFPGERKPFGTFVGTFLKKDFVFKIST